MVGAARVRVAAVFVAGLLLGTLGWIPGASFAGPPGTWTPLPGATTSTYESSLLRTGDGVLHVFGVRKVGTMETIVESRISAAGTLLGTTNVLPAPWAIINQHLRAVSLPGGTIGLAYSGIKTTSPGEPRDGSQMYLATWTPDSGWSEGLYPASVRGDGSTPYGSYGTGAVMLADGSTMVAWVFNGNLYWSTGSHFVGSPGTNPTASIGSANGYSASLVRNGDKVFAAWYGNDPRQGTWVKQLLPTPGPARLVPGSTVSYRGTTQSLAPSGPVAMVAAGAGVAVAYCKGYPSCTSIQVWRSDTGRITVVPGSANADTEIAMSTAPGSRLWVAWHTYGEGRVRATRSAPGGSPFGAVQMLSATSAGADVYGLSLNGSIGRGDVVVNDGSRMLHQQVRAGLTLKASPAKWRKNRTQKVVFTVLDAGRPVAGARVAAPGRKSCRTAASGKCTVKLRKAGLARATATGYAPATVRLRAVR